MQLDKLMNTKGLPRYITLSPLKYDGKKLSYDIKIKWWGMIILLVKTLWRIYKNPNDHLEVTSEEEQNNAV